MFCMFRKILYYAIGEPSGIYPCAIKIRQSCSSPGARTIVYQSQSSLRMYLLIVGRLDVDGQSFAPIGLHKTDAASDWLVIKCHCTG
jgi:hypothetical protein